MITKVNDIDLKILILFTNGYNKEYYIREVAKLVNISSRTALLTLSKLEKRGILESRTRGKIKNYKIIKSFISREYFILTEQYKKISFLEKNHLLKEIFEKIDKHIQGISIIFGSYAKGTQHKNSDIDLFIVGKYDEEMIKNFGKMYGVDINIKSYPLRTFEKEIYEDILLKEIVENHVVIKSVEQFVESVLRWIKLNGA